MKKYFNLVFLSLMVLSAAIFAGRSIMVMRHQEISPPKRIIVIDPGHGGKDPGKVGCTGVLEKDVNLRIAHKLKLLLEQNDFQVIMTRMDDRGLYSESDSNKKRVDLKNRVDLINQSNAVLVVSIHQNSFSQQSSRGAQVFYYNKSPEGEVLAKIIQEQMKETLGDGNHRVAKPNDSYYMLKKTQCPLVIVESGFLSNPEEEQLLTKDEYQEKMAWAIHLAIHQFLKLRK